MTEEDGYDVTADEDLQEDALKALAAEHPIRCPSNGGRVSIPLSTLLPTPACNQTPGTWLLWAGRDTKLST